MNDIGMINQSRRTVSFSNRASWRADRASPRREDFQCHTAARGNLFRLVDHAHIPPQPISRISREVTQHRPCRLSPSRGGASLGQHRVGAGSPRTRSNRPETRAPATSHRAARRAAGIPTAVSPDRRLVLPDLLRYAAEEIGKRQIRIDRLPGSLDHRVSPGGERSAFSKPKRRIVRRTSFDYRADVFGHEEKEKYSPS